MIDPFGFEFSSTQTTSSIEFSSTKSTIDFEFENTIKIGDGIVLPTPITIEEYNAIAVKDPSAYYFIVG